jgi:hypothetical protein
MMRSTTLEVKKTMKTSLFLFCWEAEAWAFCIFGPPLAFLRWYSTTPKHDVNTLLLIAYLCVISLNYGKYLKEESKLERTKSNSIVIGVLNVIMIRQRFT